LPSKLLPTACLILFPCLLRAQDAQSPIYLNTGLPAEQRAADLVHRMTLQEKTSQLVNQARAIPRLKVPAYDWWNESLHGVKLDGTTEFPEPIGLAATFDAPAIHDMAVAISLEGRIKHAQAVRAGHSDIFEGLDFWAPNINIFRDPRWGRGQETYGEDPFLAARLGVAFVTGMQGDDPRYYRTIATPKHFAVHSGPEPTRHTVDVPVSKHDELDTYLPAFRAAVTEGKAGSVMCAYNSVNGQPACASEFLLEDQLRGKWGFQGYVVSDCGAVRDIHSGHHYAPTQAEAAAISIKRGMDNECIDIGKVTDDKDYAPYLEAVKKGLLQESEIDAALVRLFTARMKLGMFDPPEMAPYTKIDEKLLDSASHRALARKLANESMVLLKNDGVLPLKGTGGKIAIIGPLADQTRVLLGNYNGTPTHSVSVLEGMQAAFPAATIQFVPGTPFLRGNAGGGAAVPVPNECLSIKKGKPGVNAEYESEDFLTSRKEAGINLTNSTAPPKSLNKSLLNVVWNGALTPDETGEYLLGFQVDGSASVSLDGKGIVSADDTGQAAKLGKTYLEKGRRYELEVKYHQRKPSNVLMRLMWSPLDRSPVTVALTAAQAADVVVAVVGITSELEGEDMDVSVAGFQGGDRTSLDLPKPEQELLEAVAAAGKPLVVVLMNGSALSVNWAKEHANAILEAWYPGEEGGAAVAETLAGRNNPAGRLPVTVYRDVKQLPPFEDYSMQGRTYRYFDGAPLFPFGYGLSYTTFAYSQLKVPSSEIAAGSPVAAEVTVTNAGRVGGDEAVQLYLQFPGVPGAPLKALRGFRRVHLEPGSAQNVRFELQPRDLSMVTEAGEVAIVEGEYTLSIGGGQPGSGAPVATGTFRVKGRVVLPE